MAMRGKPPGFDIIEGDLPPGFPSIAKRVENLTTTLDGTQEQPEIGLISRVKKLEGDYGKLMARLNMWGYILLGAFAVSGFMNGKAAGILHTILTGLGAGAG